MSSVLTLNGGVLVSNGVAVSHEGGSSANIQEDKTYTVSASGNQTISPDTGYDGMAAVALSVPAGSGGTPYATKGTVSNHTVSVIPSVTNTTGWITGEIKDGTAVSVSASELVSGTYSVTSSGTKDVTNYASASVPAGTATAPTSITGTGATASSSSTTITLTKSVSNTPRITTAGYISSGTAGSSSISLSATDSNFLAENIKNGVTLFGKAGSYTGGNVVLNPYVIRPDAELIKTYSDDFLVITDKGVTKPAYTTTSTTLITGGTALSSTVSLSNTNYRYYIVMRYLTIPQYSVTTTAAARQEYTAMSAMYEVTNYDANTFSALVSSTKYASRNAAILAVGNSFVRCIYWSSASAIKVYTANSYGCAQTINTAPAISSGTSDSPTITFYTPNVVIRGSSTYLNSTYWGYITDIRCQYIYEVYRVPKTTTSTYGVDGWAQYNNMLQLINCAQSATHKLT